MLQLSPNPTPSAKGKRPSQQGAGQSRKIQQRIDLLFEKPNTQAEINASDADVESDTFDVGQIGSAKITPISASASDEECGNFTGRCADNPLIIGFDAQAVNSPVTADSDDVIFEDSEVFFKEVSKVPRDNNNEEITDYGSDYESVCDSMAGQEGINVCQSQGIVTSEEMENANWRSEMEKLIQENEDAPLSVKHWKLMMDQLKEIVHTQVQEENKIINEQVKTIGDNQVSNNEELSKCKTQLKVCQMQLNEVIGVMIRQEQMINECREHIETLTHKLNKNTLRITGLDTMENENCIDVVADFFKQRLGIQQDIVVSDAFRVNGNVAGNKPMIVHLQNAWDKGIIFKNTKKLKDQVNASDQPFSVSDQLSAKRRAERQRTRQLLAANRELENSPAQKNRT